MKKTGWIILGVIVVLVLWVFSGYNGLVEKQEQATTELANVQTQYQRRADMMPQLAKIVKAYAKHEKETFEAVTKARAAVGQVKLDASNLTEAKLKEYTAAQGELANAFSKLMVVAEKYPELKASENFKSLQIQEEASRIVSVKPVANIMMLFRLIIRQLEKCQLPLLLVFSISRPCRNSRQLQEQRRLQIWISDSDKNDMELFVE